MPADLTADSASGQAVPPPPADGSEPRPGPGADPGPEAGPDRRSSRRRWLGALVLVIVLGLVLGVRWLTNAQELGPYGVGYQTATNAVGQTVYADSGIYGEAQQDANGDIALVLDAVTPRVTKNTAGARVEVVVCVRKATASPIGMVRSGLDQHCTRVDRLRTPAHLTVGYGSAQLLLQVTPTRPGEVRIEGFDVRYRDGIRFGSQHTGLATIVSTP